MTVSRSLVVLAVASVPALASCTARGPERASPAVAAPAVAATEVVEADLRKGTGCAAAIARVRAVVESDVATGNLNEPVGQRFLADLDQASTACAGGREGDASRQLSAAKARYGYR